MQVTEVVVGAAAGPLPVAFLEAAVGFPSLETTIVIMAGMGSEATFTFLKVKQHKSELGFDFHEGQHLLA